MRDKIGRKINYLRFSITNNCNLRCIYCMPSNIEKSEEYLKYEDIVKVVKICCELGINKIRYTGGEPLLRKDIEKIIFATSNIKGINDISITTNGILLSDIAENLKKAGLTRVNISLDTLDSDKFKKITRGGSLKNVLKSIDKCLSIGLNPVKINVVFIKGVNDMELENFIIMAKELPVEVRFIELMPIGEAINLFKSNYLNIEEILKAYHNLKPMGLKKNSTVKLYYGDKFKGRIGVITPVSSNFCFQCNKIRITSNGTIKQCLHSKEEISILEYLNNEEKLKDVFKSVIYNKPIENNLSIDRKSKSNRMMYEIGG